VQGLVLWPTPYTYKRHFPASKCGELYLNTVNGENYATEVDIFREEMKSRLKDWTGNRKHLSPY
jgi:hypothetical protein